MNANSIVNIEFICHELQVSYSACDISDALLKLGVPQAGYLPDILPLLPTRFSERGRLVAPVSTVLFLPNAQAKSGNPGPHIQASNIPKGQSWTDLVPPGTIVVTQQPPDNISAMFGDIFTTRLQKRGIVAAVADGRARDVGSCRNMQGMDGTGFQVWSKGVSAASPTLEIRPWAVEVPLDIGGVRVEPGDVICLDQVDEAVVVIPRSSLQGVYELLPQLKKASDGVLEDVQNGLSAPEAVKRHPDFYSNY